MRGRWSSKVVLPLGPQWGNGGGVAACMNWSSNIAPKPPISPPKDINTYRNTITKRVQIKGDYRPTDSPFNYDNVDPGKYMDISAWDDNVGLTRVDGKLKLTNLRKGHETYRENFTDGDFYRDSSKADNILAYDEFGRDDELARTSRLAYRPPTPSRKFSSTQAHTRAVAEAHQSLGRTAPSAPKRYGIMGPPTQRKTATTPHRFSRASRPVNPSPHSPNEEVYKYTEREFIVEDIDDDKAAVKERSELYTSRSKPNYRSGESTKNLKGFPHYDLNGRPHTGRDTSRMRESQKYFSLTTPPYGNNKDVDNFLPTPVPSVWQTKEFDSPIKTRPLTSRPTSAGPRDFTFSLEPTRPTGGKNQTGNTRFSQVASKSRADENIMIHVDCSKLAKSTRPTTVTVRLHGVDDSSKVDTRNGYGVN